MDIDRIIKIVRNLKEEAVPTNNVGGGNIAGTSEAGDDPTCYKKEKENKYIYMKGTRKLWQQSNGVRFRQTCSSRIKVRYLRRPVQGDVG